MEGRSVSNQKLFHVIQWSKLEYEENYDDYNVENNILGNVRSHKDTFYVCIPRWRDGVPATLNTLTKSDSAKLRPFPNLASNQGFINLSLLKVYKSVLSVEHNNFF